MSSGSSTTTSSRRLRVGRVIFWGFAILVVAIVGIGCYAYYKSLAETKTTSTPPKGQAIVDAAIANATAPQKAKADCDAQLQTAADKFTAEYDRLAKDYESRFEVEKKRLNDRYDDQIKQLRLANANLKKTNADLQSSNKLLQQEKKGLLEQLVQRVAELHDLKNKMGAQSSIAQPPSVEQEVIVNVYGTQNPSGVTVLKRSVKNPCN